MAKLLVAAAAPVAVAVLFGALQIGGVRTASSGPVSVAWMDPPSRTRAAEMPAAKAAPEASPAPALAVVVVPLPPRRDVHVRLASSKRAVRIARAARRAQPAAMVAAVLDPIVPSGGIAEVR